MEFVFLSDAMMARDAFEQLPLCAASSAEAIIAAAKGLAGRTCRALIERDGTPTWHAIAWLNINGTECATAARVKLGRYRSED